MYVQCLKYSGENSTINILSNQLHPLFKFYCNCIFVSRYNKYLVVVLRFAYEYHSMRVYYT